MNTVLHIGGVFVAVVIWAALFTAAVSVALHSTSVAFSLSRRKR
jgi:hypothetical protein